MSQHPEPFPGFESVRAMPEVAGHTVGQLGQGNMGLGLTCRDCGRQAAFTPLGIRTQLHRYRDTPVPVFARACRCQTCEGSNVVAHGVPLEPQQQARPYILFREKHRGPRLDRL